MAPPSFPIRISTGRDSLGDRTNLNLGYKTGLALSGAVGYRLPYKYLTYFQPRVEADLTYTANPLGGGSFEGFNKSSSENLKTLSLYVNNYSDILWKDDQKIIPYVGGGIGVTFVELDSPLNEPGLAGLYRAEADDTAFSGHFAAGVTYKATEKVEIFTEARYTMARDVEIRRIDSGSLDARTEGDLNGTTVSLGLRYTLW